MEHTYSQPAVAARLLLTRGTARSGSPTDAEIVAASMREPDAFTRLFERHWEALFRFCQSRAGSAGEDIAAEAFRVAFDRRAATTPATAMPARGSSGSPPTYCATTSAAPGARSRSSHAQRRLMCSHRAMNSTSSSVRCWDRRWQVHCRASRPPTGTLCCCWPGQTSTTSRSLRRSIAAGHRPLADPPRPATGPRLPGYRRRPSNAE